MSMFDAWNCFATLAAAAPTDPAADTIVNDGPAAGELFAPLLYAVVIGMVVTGTGMLLCLIRLMRGPTLPDRVIAADLFALHVIAAVVLLTIYLGDDTYFGSVLGIAIIGFASTVGFAQLIGATGRNADLPQRYGEQPLDRGDWDNGQTVNVCPHTGDPLPPPTAEQTPRDTTATPKPATP